MSLEPASRDASSGDLLRRRRARTGARVAVLAVPLGPADREVADLIAARARGPTARRSASPATARGSWWMMSKNGRQAVDLVQLAGEHGREIEAESVDVHLRHPVAQAVHDQLDRARVAHVEAVAGAGVIGVEARVLGSQAIVGGVVDAAEARASGRGGCPRRCGCRRRRESPRCPPSGSVFTIDLNSYTCWPSPPRRVARRRARRSRSSCSPSSSSGLCSARCRSMTNWCTGRSSTAVTPSALKVLERSDRRRARGRCRGAAPGRRDAHRHPLDVAFVDDRAIPRRPRAAVVAPGERRRR